MNTCNNRHLFLSKETSDVTLVIDGTELPAHRAILSGGSKYFNVMFSGSFAEAKSDKVELKETNIKAFKLVLKYIYNGSLYQFLHGYNTCFEDIFEVLVCAQFYMVDALVKYAVTIVKKKLACSPIKLLDYAAVYSVDKLISYSSCRIQKNAPFIFERNEFKQLSALTVQLLLKLRLNARESTIFQALIDWMLSNPGYCESFLELLQYIDLYLLEERHLNMLFKPTQLVDPGLFQKLLNEQKQRSEKVTKVVNQNVLNGLHDLRIVAGKKFTRKNYWGWLVSPLYKKNTVIVDLKQQFLLNCLKLFVYGFIRDVFYTVSVSKDGRHWDLVVDHSKHDCFLLQLLYFNERPVRFIRIQCVGNNAFNLSPNIEALYSTDPLEIDDGRNFLIPKQKLDLRTMILISGDRLYYENRCEYVGFEINLHLPQPCIIDTVKLLLKESSSYELEISVNKVQWTRVLTEVNVFQWRTATFQRQHVRFIKVTGRAHLDRLRVQDLEVFAS